MTEMIEQKSGVGAFIVDPHRPDLFLAITELTSNESSNKLPNMYSPPFETIEKGETHKDALGRIFTEELKIIKGKISLPEDLGKKRLCSIQLSLGVWLHAYLIEIPKGVVFGRGEMKDEVGPPFWVTMRSVLRTDNYPYDLTFRPGTLEIVKSYCGYLCQDNFQSLVYPRTFHSIPLVMFDLNKTRI